MSSRRVLHFVFKIGDRKSSIHFFRDVLGMKVLRHEEFDGGCIAVCNGPYDGKWSKTMIGYGPEDDHFVCELIYNYGISHYPLGNDFLGLYIQSSEAVSRARTAGISLIPDEESGYFLTTAPGGYKFYLKNEPQPINSDPVQKISFASSNLKQSLTYWRDYAGMTVFEQDKLTAHLGCHSSQIKLFIKDIGCPVDHAKGFGRIAFSCPSKELKDIEAQMRKQGQKILTPYVSLDTPGKATVQVVILADPDGHEICFVGDEGFRQLSQMDPNGEVLLKEAMEQDKSDEWFASKGGKGEA